MSKRILIRTGRAPHQSVRVEAAHAYRNVGTYSTNTGNLLFLDAIYRTLVSPDTELVPDSMGSERRGLDQAYIDRINDEFDMVVLPLANAFRPDFLNPLTRLATLVEGLKIPVVVPCVGGQARLGADPLTTDPEVNQASHRFISAVLERSHSIGIRGELTLEYLVGLGFEADRFEIVGCPSLHVSEPNTMVHNPTGRLSTNAKVAINLTPQVPAAQELLDHSLGHYPNLTYLAQDHETAALLLWGEPFEAAPGMPGSLDHPLITENKIRLITDPRPWLDFLSDHEFVAGTRIHGNIAALLAGVPALTLAHDSRTLELCRFHQIPHLELDQAGNADTVDLAELAERTDLAAFNQVREPNRQRWLEFLEHNDLPHSGELDADYESKLADVHFPEPVQPLSWASGAELASRMNWLRQGSRGDAVRTQGAYQPPIIPEGGRQLDTLERIARVRDAQSAANKRLKALESQLARLTKRVDKLYEPRPTFTQRVSRKLKRIFSR